MATSTKKRYAYVILRLETPMLNTSLSKDRIQVLYAFHSLRDACQRLENIVASILEETGQNGWMITQYSVDQDCEIPGYRLWGDDMIVGQLRPYLGKFWMERVLLEGLC